MFKDKCYCVCTLFCTGYVIFFNTKLVKENGMIVKVLSIWLLVFMIIGFNFTFKRKFKGLIMSFNNVSSNEARYAFAGDIE